MPRWVFRLPIVFALGAVLNVLVAWACIGLSNDRNFDPALTGRLRAQVWDAAGGRQDTITVSAAFTAFGTVVATIAEDEPVMGSRVAIHQHWAGWPMRSFIGNDLRFRGVANPLRLLTRPRHSISLGQPLMVTYFVPPSATMPSAPTGTIPRLLPLDPLPLGFAVNCLFFAAVVWLSWFTPRVLRSLKWAIQRRCLRCGYPVGVSPVCTECGRRLSRFESRRTAARVADVTQSDRSSAQHKV
jgi:hypothetical protein